MTTTTVTLTGNVSDAIEASFDPRRTKAYVRHNTDKIVTDSGPMHLGGGTVNVESDGTFTLPNVVASTSLVENLQATVCIDYADPATRTRKIATFGPYDLSAETGTIDVRALEAVQALDPSFASVTMSQMQALLDEMTEISGLSDLDESQAYNIENGPATQAALSASTAEQLETPGTASNTVVERIAIDASNYPTVQAALDAAPAGARVRTPAGVQTIGAGQEWLPKAPFQVLDMRASQIEVTAWGTPAIRAFRDNGAEDLTLDFGTVEYTGTRGDHTGTDIYGGKPYVSGCAFWGNGDRNHVRSLRSIGMPTPIYFSSWDGTGPSDRMGVGNRISYFEAEQYDFGLLYVGQKAFDWGTAYLHDDIDDSGGVNPTHAIYCSGNSTLGSGAGTIGRWVVENNTGGHAFQFKYQDLLTVGALLADDTKGVLSLIDCDDLDITSVVGVNQRSTGGAGCISFGFTTAVSARPNIGRIKIIQNSAVNERAVNLYADDAYIGTIDVVSNRTVADGNDGEVIVRGSRNYIETLRTRAAGSAAMAALVGYSGTAATDSVIARVHATNAFSMPVPVTVTSSPGARFGLAPRDATTSAVPTDGGRWERNTDIRNYAPSAGGAPGWVCTTAGAAGLAWAASTAVAVGAVRVNGANAYTCTTAGTTASSGGPTGTGTGITDGSAVWNFVSVAAVFKAKASLAS